MRPLWFASIVFAVVLVAGFAGAEHVDESEFRCSSGYCEDGEHRWLNCEDGHCEGTPRGFPTITNPSYGDGSWLTAEDRVLVVTLGDEAPHAYPLRVMNIYETIEETFAGDPVLITYCPLCGSGVVFDRTLNDRPITMLNSGMIWNNDLVMYDLATESLWTQIGGEAIVGERHGDTLDLMPSRIVSWGPWSQEHPDTRVLERPVDRDGDFLADFSRDHYASYQHSPDAPQGHDVSGPWHPKTNVVGVHVGDEALAFPFPEMKELLVHHVTLEGVNLVAGYAAGGVHVYEADERVFEPADQAGMMVDAEGTVWSITTGESEHGDALEPVPQETMFWFAWASFNPGTEAIVADDVDALDEEEEVQGAPFVGVAALVSLFVVVSLVRRA